MGYNLLPTSAVKETCSKYNNWVYSIIVRKLFDDVEKAEIMDMKFTDEQVAILLNLVKKEMDGICGDLGYAELHKIKKILEEHQSKS